MKAKASKPASASLRHTPIGERRQKPKHVRVATEARDASDDEDDTMPASISANILRNARDQKRDMMLDMDEDDDSNHEDNNSDDEDGSAAANSDGEGLDDYGDDEVDPQFVYVNESDLGSNGLDGMDKGEEDLISKFLQADKVQTRSLADIIMEKLREKEAEGLQAPAEPSSDVSIPQKVIEVYTAVGSMLQHYRSGKLPKALKMLPHLKNWEQILWLTRPDLWSPVATYAVTRIFVSNLKVKMAQRFFNLVLLEKCRDDINSNSKLNYHLYMALKKALFKPAAFYKGIFLPLAQSGTCSLREATIIGSVLMKVSVPAIHSAAALLRLAEMPYSGSTSAFIKTLLLKKYALPARVLDALVEHFVGMSAEQRVLPVIWHQSLLLFVQRYKLEIGDAHRDAILQLIKVQSHHEIGLEIRRELMQAALSR